MGHQVIMHLTTGGGRLDLLWTSCHSFRRPKYVFVVSNEIRKMCSVKSIFFNAESLEQLDKKTQKSRFLSSNGEIAIAKPVCSLYGIFTTTFAP